jgi:hypothetical protein
MSFADIINAESKKLEQSGNNTKVKYPETKHKRLFFEKNQPAIFLQILPAANLVSGFAEACRKVFLSAKTSQGKELNSNFTLDAEPNAGSLLEQKIAEWADKGLIPNGFGGQTSPKRVFTVNAVKVVQNPANPQQYVQERDQQGNLVVRTFDMPQSGYQNYIRKLQDPLFNTSGTELSFMDINKPALVKISKPAKGQMEYPVEVYTNVMLPPLGQGWENQLEDLKAQCVPTERLENGYEWVAAFCDMKEGRKPQRQNTQTPEQPQVNPYANLANLGTQTHPNTLTLIIAPGTINDPFANGIGEETDINNLMPSNMTPPPPQHSSAPVPPTPSHNSNGLPDIEAMLQKELGNL